MTTLTREQIKAIGENHWKVRELHPEQVKALCTMAISSITLTARVVELKAALIIAAGEFEHLATNPRQRNHDNLLRLRDETRRAAAARRET